ncbi:MAG: EamA family transporter [Clostridia bacterium]|nr:EamA family transporter [Clostridia bacterium]
MSPYVYLISCVFFLSSSSIFGSLYNRKNEGRQGTTPFYNFLQICSVFLCWVIMFAVDGSFSWEVLPYSIIFAVGYTLCNIFVIQALKCGSVALTSLIMQLSLIGATIWGFFFWGDTVTPIVVVGLILVVCSLALCLYNGKGEKEQKINLKWIIFVAIMFLGNACGTIAQKTQQIDFVGKYGNFFMVLATGLSTITCLVLYLKSDRTDNKEILKGSWYYPVSSGVLNAVHNLFVILLATSPISPSFVYPVLSVGSLMVTTLFSSLVFKEKMDWWQWLGVAIGSVAIVMLSV